MGGGTLASTCEGERRAKGGRDWRKGKGAHDPVGRGGKKGKREEDGSCSRPGGEGASLRKRERQREGGDLFFDREERGEGPSLVRER